MGLLCVPFCQVEARGVRPDTPDLAVEAFFLEHGKWGWEHGGICPPVIFSCIFEKTILLKKMSKDRFIFRPQFGGNKVTLNFLLPQCTRPVANDSCKKTHQ